MLNKEQYEILNLIKPHNEVNPITATEVINQQLYDGLSCFSLTDEHLHTLFDFGYIKCPDTPAVKYHTGYTGDVYVTSTGRMAMNDYEHQVQLAESVAELRALANASKEVADIAKSEAKAAKSNAKNSKLISIISLSISAVSVISAIILHFI